MDFYKTSDKAKAEQEAWKQLPASPFGKSCENRATGAIMLSLPGEIEENF